MMSLIFSIKQTGVPVGGALAGVLVPPLVLAFGWRWGAFFAGCAFLVICIPLSLKVIRAPENLGLEPDGNAPPPSDSLATARWSRAESADVSAAEALKTVAFWYLAFSMLVRVGTQSTMMVHFIPIMVWKGITQERAALLLSAFALLNLMFHFLLGWIADRVNKPRLLSLWMFLPVSAIFVLIAGESSWTLWLFAVLYSALDAAFPVTWAISGDFFGRRHFATIRGNMTFFYMWGSAFGPVIAGYVYDQTQSYMSVLWGMAALLSLSVLLTGLLIKPWRLKIASLSGSAVGAAPGT